MLLASGGKTKIEGAQIIPSKTEVIMGDAEASPD